VQLRLKSASAAGITPATTFIATLSVTGHCIGNRNEQQGDHCQQGNNTRQSARFFCNIYSVRINHGQVPVKN
jgi:hypothetical protein